MSLIKVKGSSITGALAAVDGSALTGISSGIGVAGHFRLHTGFTGNANPITILNNMSMNAMVETYLFFIYHILHIFFKIDQLYL